jgi:hypothetical protein
MAFHSCQAIQGTIGQSSYSATLSLSRSRPHTHFHSTDFRSVLPDKYKAPRSSLLRRSSHFGYEGRKLRGILRNSPTRRPEPLGGVPKPLPSFAKATEGSPRLAYSAEAAASAAKTGHPRSTLRVCGEGESRLVPEYPHGEAQYSG